MSTTLLSTILEDYCYSRSLHYLCAEFSDAYEDIEKDETRENIKSLCYRVIDSNDFICPKEVEENEINEVIDFVENFDTFER